MDTPRTTMVALAWASLKLRAADGDRHQHGGQRAGQRQQQQQEAAGLGKAELEQGRQRLAAQQPLPGQEAQAGQHRDQHAHAGHGGPLAQHQGAARRRVHQQRLERAALALARRGVQRRVQRAIEHRHQHEEGQHGRQLCRAHTRRARSRSSTWTASSVAGETPRTAS
jgi:hypothetical protein